MKTLLSCAIMHVVTEPSLAGKLETGLPSELGDFIETAGRIASRLGQKLYLIGGAVRYLLLEKPNFDLDLVVEGNAIELAQQLTKINQSKIITHPRFGTAKLSWSEWSVDLATARSETYSKPGVLPKVKPSFLKIDLSRRDFTINAMAIYLNPSHYGKLLDPYEGRRDLEHEFIRVLHEKSFIDDATRIGVVYATNND